MSQTLTESPAWRALQLQAQTMRERRLASLFEADPRRAQDFALDICGLHLDYSKQKLDAQTRELLLALARQQQVAEGVARMFAGERINATEHRAVLHVALRAPRGTTIGVDGEDQVARVQEVIARMRDFAERVRDGRWRGATGQPIRDVVNIGIGGSDLGPRMVCDALADFADGPRTQFVANVDGAQLSATIAGLDPATTLFIITSKTFTTQETMANAGAARAWLVAALGEAAVARHFVAVSTNAEAVAAFGIASDNMFEFWDWVGGRYSVWSAVGLSVMLAIGPDRFGEWLAGAHAMDEHFRSADLARNMPVLLALVAVWNFNFLGYSTQVVAPYAQRLEFFVPWLQQLEMESNGKRVHRSGAPVTVRTTPAIWGDVGTNSQHAFFQMLHQGSEVHPVDFILPIEAAHPLAEQQAMLIANCLAQSAALMQGKTAEQVREELSAKLSGEALEAAIPHRVFPGDRPSNTILLRRLEPRSLGALMALYEHRTYVLSLLWDIHAFDQWGVELGKQLAKDLLRAMNGDTVTLDPSTAALLARVQRGS